MLTRFLPSMACSRLRTCIGNSSGSMPGVSGMAGYQKTRQLCWAGLRGSMGMGLGQQGRVSIWPPGTTGRWDTGCPRSRLHCRRPRGGGARWRPSRGSLGGVFWLGTGGLGVRWLGVGCVGGMVVTYGAGNRSCEVVCAVVLTCLGLIYYA